MPAYDEEKLQVSFLRYPSNEALLEALIIRPHGKGPFPGVVFVHGHDSNCWRSLWIGYCLSQCGFACFLPTQLGYRFSTGTRDFCGPETVRAILDGTVLFQNKSFVNKRNIGVWGISRGAVVAGLAAVIRPRFFRAAVLQSGIYDFVSYMSAKEDEGIQSAIRTEAGKNKEAFVARSILNKTEQLSCPTLILHGEEDKRIPAQQARLLDEHLSEFKKRHQTVIVPKAGHLITEATLAAYTIPFLKRHLRPSGAAR